AISGDGDGERGSLAWLESGEDLVARSVGWMENEKGVSGSWIKKATVPSPQRFWRGSSFYYAEDHHQQYLKRVPKGYCGLKGTGVSCPIGAGKDEL
ncbi:hypothetical protein KUCAC02_026275, partial [Chaenocephalus aceratus]